MKLKDDIIHFDFLSSCSYRMATQETPPGKCFFIRRFVTIVKIVVMSIFNKHVSTIDQLQRDSDKYSNTLFSDKAREKGFIRQQLPNITLNKQEQSTHTQNTPSSAASNIPAAPPPPPPPSSASSNTASNIPAAPPPPPPPSSASSNTASNIPAAPPPPSHTGSVPPPGQDQGINEPRPRPRPRPRPQPQPQSNSTAPMTPELNSNMIVGCRNALKNTGYLAELLHPKSVKK